MSDADGSADPTQNPAAIHDNVTGHMTMKYLIPGILVSVLTALPGRAVEKVAEHDVVIYGGTSAACIALDDGMSVQDVDYRKLRVKLLADNQILGKSHRLPDPRKKEN